MKFVFLGPPGAGKGTLAAEITKEFGIVQISTGDIFRAAIKNETDLGLQVKELIEAGGLVSDDLTIALVKERLEQDDVKESFILDGFPRTIAQAEALETLTDLTAVIDFSVEDDVLIKRLCGRRLCSGCGKIYHIETMPPKREGLCDVCGQQLMTRKDDTLEVVKSRLKNYHAQTAPLIDFYRKKNMLFTIDAKRPISDSVKELGDKIKTNSF